MSNRKSLFAAAACAVLAMSGLARADDAPPAHDPLMNLLVTTGVGKGLEDAGITVGGRVEGSFTYGLGSPLNNTITGRTFDFEHEDLTLNQAALYVNRDVDTTKFDVGGRMEWIFGGDSRLIHAYGLFDSYGVGEGPDAQWDLNQLYGDISFGSGLKLRVGKFVALAGYEVIDPTGNALYSHSFMFGYAIPFTHTGALMSWKQSDQLTITAGFSRGWDTSLEDTNGTLDYLGQLALTSPDGKTSTILNVTAGPEQAGDNGNWRTLLDLIVSTKVGDNLTLALNADYGYEANSASSVKGSDAQWYGIAGYATVKINEMISYTIRAEYFNDQDGARLTGAVGGTSVYEGTVGFAITPFPNDPYGKGLTIRPEVRLDYSDKRFWDGGSDRYQVTAAIDAIYKF